VISSVSDGLSQNVIMRHETRGSAQMHKFQGDRDSPDLYGIPDGCYLPVESEIVRGDRRRFIRFDCRRRS
jgi:hypothetical protein